MAVEIFDGKPGTGKTLLLTYFSYRDFNRKNPPLKVWFTEKILRKKYVYDFAEYSDFPILYKKPKKGRVYYIYDDDNNIIPVPYISSLQCRLFDLFIDNKFRPNADFSFDEMQTKYDSMDYKEFPDCNAHYFQLHRHFDNNIRTCSQSQSRIIKRVLCLGEIYYSIISFKIIFGWVFIRVRISYDMHNSLENDTGNHFVEFEEKVFHFRIKKIGSMYDSKYCRALQEGSKLYPSKMYDSLLLTKEQLLHNWFPTTEEKKRLKEMRY